MASAMVRAALRLAFIKLVGREPSKEELDQLEAAYDRESGLPAQKAKQSLRKFAKVYGHSTSDDNIDRIVGDIENILKGQ